MTLAEKQAYARDLRKAMRAAFGPDRDSLLRQGLARPRNQREREIFASNQTGQRDTRADDPEPPGAA